MRTLIVLSILATAAPAAASKDLPAAPYGQSSRGKSYWRDVENLYLAGLRASCVADDVDKWRRGLADWTTAAEKLTDANDRKLYLDYLGTVRAYIDAHAA